MINLLRTRRSIRKYSSAAVDSRMTSILVEAMLRSPTSRGTNSWEFIVVDDRNILSKLSIAREHGSKHLQGAPLGIVVCADSTKTDVWVEDCSIAAILIQLTAHDLGLGSCWIQVRNRNHTDAMSAEQYIQGVLGLPQHIKVECMISIGHPDEIKKPVADSDLDRKKVKHNNYATIY